MTTTSTKPEALLWIDMETTGPDRTTAQILEIGMACTDSTATQDYGAFHAIVKPDILDISRITPWAWEHHTANGLIAEVRAASTRQNGPAAVGNAAEEYLESLEQRGSSPHVRGALNRACAVCAVVGIIPACAGSTVSVPNTTPQSWDHPRMCGEHPRPGVARQHERGSSPHVRGARND